MRTKSLKYAILLLMLLLPALPCAGQESQRVEMDASSLSAGEPFRITTKVTSDEALSFAGTEARLFALLCPVGAEEDECIRMNREVTGADETDLNVTFSVDALPYGGDYTLDISFADTGDTFASASSAYLLKGVKEKADYQEVQFHLSAGLYGGDGTLLYSGLTLNVGKEYSLWILADTAPGDAVTVQAALPASFAELPLDPESSCASYYDAESNTLQLPGSLWNAENGNSFQCSLRFLDEAAVAAEPVTFTLKDGTPDALNTLTELRTESGHYTLGTLVWNNYPLSVTRIAGSHQLYIANSAGTPLCYDNLACGWFSGEDTYTLHYTVPATWAAPLASGESFSAELQWPEDWASALRESTPQLMATEGAEPCLIDASGVTTLNLTESETPGRYEAVCVFSPALLTVSESETAVVHQLNELYKMDDLNFTLASYIQHAVTPTLAETPEEVITETPVPVTQVAGSHQLYIANSAGTPLCYDNLACGWFSGEDTYTLHYTVPATWAAPLASGESFSAELQWPEDWASALRESTPQLMATEGAEPCLIDASGVTTLNLTESETPGRYEAVCVFSPALLTVSESETAVVHQLNELYKMDDLNFTLASYIQHAVTPTLAETPEITETPQAETALPTEAAILPEETGTPIEATILPEETGTGTPEDAITETPDAETPVVETMIVDLVPGLYDAMENALIYGSTLYVGNPYTLRLDIGTAMSDAVAVEMTLPDTYAVAALDSSASCMAYLREDGKTLRFPGSLWNAENNGSFSCELRFTEEAAMYLQPIHFALYAADEQSTVPWQMPDLDWSAYPTTVVRAAGSSSVMITDSRGNQLCGGNTYCGYFNADEVYTLTYSFPADWGAAVPSGGSYTATVTWPEIWASGIRQSNEYELMSAYGTPCEVDASGMSHLTLSETSEGHYTASCTFMADNIPYPQAEAAVLHLEDNSWKVDDLSIYMPAVIQKNTVQMTPSLTMVLQSGGSAEEQIQGGMIQTLYRSLSYNPNSQPSAEDIAAYTLSARVDGVSGARKPKDNDSVLVNWVILDDLSRLGELPDCLVPENGGYRLGTLYEAEDGSWRAECSFRLPRNLSEEARYGGLEMSLNSGAYQTSSRVEMAAQPIRRETLQVNLQVPDRLLMNQMMETGASLRNAEGVFTAYQLAALGTAGVTLNCDWLHNDVSTCGGQYEINAEGNAACALLVNSPLEASVMRFELRSSALDGLFDVSYIPAQEIQIPAVTNARAALSVKLFHAGTEEPLPAGYEAAYVAGDAYQLKFFLTPDAEFADAAALLSVDGEGTVLDWPSALTLYWDLLPGGTQTLNFTRDGSVFTAFYDFSLTQGDVDLSGNSAQLQTTVNIPGWDVTLPENGAPVQLPGRILKKDVQLEFSGFYLPESGEPLTELSVGQEARFDLRLGDAAESLDLTQLQVGYEVNGSRYPLSCEYDVPEGLLRCTISPQCYDVNGDGSYPLLCGGDQRLYALYNGSAAYNAVETVSESYQVRREELSFAPNAEFSLSKDSLQKIEAASEDMASMEDGSVMIGGREVSSFLVRATLTESGMEYRTYPVTFDYTSPSGTVPETERLHLDVEIETGSKDAPITDVVSFTPGFVSDSQVFFELDFGNNALLSDGRVIREVLDKAAEIHSITLRYDGSDFVSQAQVPFTAEELDFALKVVTLAELEVDDSASDRLSFNGAIAPELLAQPFTVYCSQLYEPLHCSSEPAVAAASEGDEATQLEGEEAAQTDSNETFTALPEQNGCWGVTETVPGIDALVYTNGHFAPRCYLTAWVNGEQLWIAANEE